MKPIGKDPMLVAAATFVVPGLGHLILGRPRRALLLFLVVNSFFAAGLVLTRGAIFDMSGAGSISPSSSRLWLLLLMPIPELLNVGGTLVGSLLFLTQSHGPLLPSSPATEIGFCLTAASGVLALFAAVDAWTAAAFQPREGERDPFVACALSWLLPGAGHLWLGKRFHGWFFLASVNLVYVVGMFLGAGLVVDRERFFYYWAGQFLNGIPTVAATLGTASWRVDRTLPYLEVGLLYTTVAGLLNVLVILSACAAARGEKS